MLIRRLEKWAAALVAAASVQVSQAGLPSGYQAVEWVESTGAQGVDLGFSPAKAGGTSVDIEFELTKNVGSTAIFSGGWFDFGSYLLMLGGSEKDRIVAFNVGKEFAKYAEGAHYHLKTDCIGAYTMTVDGEVTSSGTVTLENKKSTGNHWAFCDGQNKNRNSYVRLFYLAFANSEGPIRDFVPCRRTSDDKPGLYDRTEGVFYINGLSGADLVLGPDRLLADDLKVSGSPVNCGVPSLAYGVHGAYAVGDTVNVSVDRVGENAEGTIRGTCTGYTVLTNGAVYVSGDAGSGEKVNVSFAFPDCDHGAELVFAWKAQCKVSAVSSDAERGTVSKEYEWHEAGETFSVSATPKAGHTFYRWVGSDGVEYGRNRDLTITVADTLTLTAEFGDQVTLSPSGGDDTEAIANALSTAPAGSEIRLAAGTHQIAATIVLDKDVRFYGADRETTILRGNGKQRLVKIDGTAAPKASVESLTLRNGYDAVGWGGNGGEGMTKTPGGGAVFLSGGGTVTNCIVEECSGRHNGGAYGIHAVGGLVTHTVIRNLTSANTIVWGYALIAEGGALVSHSVVSNCSDTALGGGVQSAPVEANGTGTEIRNCLITDCRYSYSGAGSDSHGMGVMFRTAGAKLVSCTITGNRINSPKGCAVYGMNEGSVKDCIIAGNVNNVNVMAQESNVGGSVTATYTASRPVLSGEGNLVAPETLFTAGTFELTPGSPLIGAGAVEAWMPGADDLKGIDRLRGDALDMGAFCYVPPLLACAISSSAPRKSLDEISAVVSSSVDGDLEGLVYHWDLDGDEDYDDVVGSDKSSVTLETSTSGFYPVRLKVVNGKGNEALSERIVFTAVPSRLYVDASCDDPVSPYGDEAHAATNLQDAVDVAISGCTIVVKPGTYELTKTLNVTERMDIRSTGGRDATVIVVVSDVPGISLDASGAVFSGFTVTNGYLKQSYYRGVNCYRGGGNLYAGEGTTVEGCRFAGARCGGTDEVGGVSLGVYNAIVRDCEIVNNNPNPATSEWQLFYGVVKVSGADSVVERCLISDNSQVKAHNAGFRRAAGLQLEGGAVRSCLLRNNRMTECSKFSSIDYGRGVAVFAKAGTLENCTIVGNVSADVNGSRCPAVQAEGTAVVRNCIIWDNKATAGADPAGEALSVANWGGTDGCFTYCCTTPALADGHSLSTDPLFKHPSAFDGVLRGVSPCARAGRFDATWMESAVDFYGTPLAVGARRNRVGMGCVSVSNSGGLMLIVK